MEVRLEALVVRGRSSITSRRCRARGRPRFAVSSSAALGLIASCLFGVSESRAHARWADGSPVPGWVTKACCGPDDAHHLRPDQVRRVNDGYVVEGYPRPIYDAQVLPSPDGEYWAFYRETHDADGRRIVTSVFCFFAPSWG